MSKPGRQEWQRLRTAMSRPFSTHRYLPQAQQVGPPPLLSQACVSSRLPQQQRQTPWQSQIEPCQRWLLACPPIPVLPRWCVGTARRRVMGRLSAGRSKEMPSPPPPLQPQATGPPHEQEPCKCFGGGATDHLIKDCPTNGTGAQRGSPTPLAPACRLRAQRHRSASTLPANGRSLCLLLTSQMWVLSRAVGAHSYCAWLQARMAAAVRLPAWGGRRQAGGHAIHFSYQLPTQS